MKWEDREASGNVDDRRGSSGFKPNIKQYYNRSK
jgi:hypothetical protein